tara:strand:+ start:1772 stop:2977 length:1206 start_codon:yes stop_codon:yes gene_type:complete
MSFPALEDQWALISRGVEEIIPEDELKKKISQSLENNKPLKIKLGCDPSRPDLHIGHSVVLRKLSHFQQLGHKAILVIGDFTAMIGDPSGRNKTRPQLTIEETKANAETYIDQAAKILNLEALEIVFNSHWLNKMNFSDVIKLCSQYTVARMLERDDFTKRFKSETPISIHEFMYPLAQGMDSVELEADIELGGTDQKFNLLVGRDLQKEKGQKPQSIITLPLLEGTDGKDKMSKSYENDIGLMDDPANMYGKTMSIPDELIYKYYSVALDLEESKLLSIKEKLDDKSTNPRDIKRDLARELVQMYHGEKKSQEAQAHFEKVIVNKENPDEMNEFKIKNETTIVDLLLDSGLAPSKGEAKRLIKQGAVKIDGIKIDDLDYQLRSNENKIIKAGKRRFLKIT